MSGLKGELSEGSKALTRQPDYFETMAVVLEEITDLHGRVFLVKEKHLFVLRRKVKTEFIEE